MMLHVDFNQRSMKEKCFAYQKFLEYEEVAGKTRANERLVARGGCPRER